jgi:Flp pilus assembly protein TadD
MQRVVVCLAVAIAVAGCAARKDVRTIRTTSAAGAEGRGHDSLDAFIQTVRARSERARPRTANEEVRTLEASEPSLADALRAVTAAPSAATHRAVAAHYVRLGVFDLAHEHFSHAVALDAKDVASWDGLARIWRDWGFPHLALADAYRALYYAPDSPIVHNTLGTVFQALGRRADARAQYEKALAIDSTAVYALTNLCYGWVLDGEAAKATDACREALRLQPDLESARNNLALAFGSAGDLPAAVATFAEAGDRARAAYNEGILHLARRRYRDALTAFTQALTSRPQFGAAEALARQARSRLREESGQ